MSEYEAEASGFGIAAVGLWPVHDRIELIGKLGLFMSDVDAESDIVFTGPISGSERSSASESGTDPFVGIGANFAVTDNLALRLEWERYTDIGDDDLGIENDLDFFGVSAVFGLK